MDWDLFGALIGTRFGLKLAEIGHLVSSHRDSTWSLDGLPVQKFFYFFMVDLRDDFTSEDMLHSISTS